MPMQKHAFFATDALATTMTGLLILVVAWRVGLSVLSQPPVSPQLLNVPPPVDARGQLVLLVERPDSAFAHQTAAARTELPDLPLRVVTLGRTSGTPERDKVQRGIRLLVHQYGYTGLPVLLAIDARGRVVRIWPLTRQARR